MVDRVRAVAPDGKVDLAELVVLGAEAKVEELVRIAKTMHAVPGCASAAWSGRVAALKFRSVWIARRGSLE